MPEVTPCPPHQAEPTMNGAYCGPAPRPGNGLGPSGECTGRETVPPCGAGMIPGRYYAYTLPGTCDGRLILDGGHWRSELPPSMRSPLLRASAARFSGLLAQRRGDPRAAEERLVTAERELREIGAAFFLAQVLVEQAELLRCADRDDDAAPLLAEATATFERLGAAPWLQRARADAAEIAA